MNEALRKSIYKDAIETFGVERQKMKLVEECGELLTAIAREGDSRSSAQDIITELADVSILIEQMALIYGPKDFKSERNRKLLRLDRRITDYKKKGCSRLLTLK